MSEFHYVRISAKLVDEFAERLAGAESLVLLGPRDVGKRYITRRLHKKLSESDTCAVGTLSFRGSDGSSHAEQFGDSEQALRWIDERLAGNGRVCLFATNVDTRAHVETLEFLAGVRSRVEAPNSSGRLAVVLTGEVDLGQLAACGDPLLRWGRPYVIQGFERQEFQQAAKAYREALGSHVSLRVPIDDDELYRRTNGNTYLLRLWLWSNVEREAWGPSRHASQPLSFEHEDDGHAPSSFYFQSIWRLIDSNPDCWRTLEALLEGTTVPVVPNGPPKLLELTGLASREGDRLILPDTFVRDHAIARYRPRRFADLYAREVDWETAFKRYSQIEDDQPRARPVSQEDVGETDDVIMRLGTSLFEAATQGPDQVISLFARGCRLALGFVEITRWRSVNRQPIADERKPAEWGAWEPVVGGPFDEAKGLAERHRQLLARLEARALPGCVLIDETERLCAVAACIAGPHPDIRDILIIGRPGERSILSNAGAEGTERLTRQFVGAYGHALDDATRRERMLARERFAYLATKINGRLGKQIRDILEALRTAARELRGEEFGYSRVVFNVIDPSQTMLLPAALEFDPTRHAPAEMRRTPFSLDDRDQRGTLWVIRHRRALVTRAAAEDPRGRHSVAVRHRIGAAAIVPLLAHDGRVVGTVQVERGDGLVPTTEEVQDLLDFGRGLAAAMELCEQLQMLQTGLDALPESIVLFDRARVARYVNPKAGIRLGFESGWFGSQEGPKLDALQVSVEEVGQDVLEQAGRKIRQMVERVDREEITGIERISDELGGYKFSVEARAVPTYDWRRAINQADGADARTGALLRVRAEEHVQRTFRALQLLLGAGNTDEILRSTVRATELLGHAWGRLYKLNGDTPPRLVSTDGFGFADAQTERQFREGGFRFDSPDGDIRWESWHCFKAERPVVFTHDPSRDDHSKGMTQLGVQTVNCKAPTCPASLAKQPGDLWIDFPLMIRDTRVGKLTLSCRPHLEPEQLRFLQILCELTGALLEAAARRERDQREKKRQYRYAAERGVHEALHTVSNWFAALEPALSRHKLSEAKLREALPEEVQERERVRKALADMTTARKRVDEAYFEGYQLFVREAVRLRESAGAMHLEPGEQTSGVEENPP